MFLEMAEDASHRPTHSSPHGPLSRKWRGGGKTTKSLSENGRRGMTIHGRADIRKFQNEIAEVAN
jgi:hypothetical protein